MMVAPRTIPIIPMMLKTSGMKENSVPDPPGAIFARISGIAEMFDSWGSYPVLCSDTGDTSGNLSRLAMHGSFSIVMAKRENSGLSAL